MRELIQKNESVESWLTSDFSKDQLQKFWTGLSQHARQELLRVDKQTFLDQVHKNMFCSRCHGFLVEKFSQIANRKSENVGNSDVAGCQCAHQDSCADKQTFLDQVHKNMFCSRCHGFLGEKFSQIAMYRKSENVGNSDVAGCQCAHEDPYADRWGCLTITRDGALTLLDSYWLSTSLKGIKDVFDYSRKRERERKLIFPYHSCGVGGRWWKGPATREACAVHTVRTSLDQLIVFWSYQKEEARQSLFRMKEEDFVEHLLFRLDNNKFCRECKKNVHREFKKIKELTSLRKESSIQFEISHDTVKADWSREFIDTEGCYHHFEWGIGTEEGKSDILVFKNVGLTKTAQVKGLDLSGLDACYITVRAWKIDEDCTELSIKAHTLEGRESVYCQLVVGDGFVTVTEGESIRKFFKRADEVVKEDNNLVDENGNRLDGGCSRPQGHPKSPEAARKFLLDAATVFFTEQVKKAFQESLARENAHSVFISLALKMLEECVHVAFKERNTLENQVKLLEEEEKEGERKSRRKNKEREKKLRRKERKENEKNRESFALTKQQLAPVVNIEESTIVAVEPDAVETGKIMSSRPVSPHIQNEHGKDVYMRKNMCNSSDVSSEKFARSNDKSGSSASDQLKYYGWKLNNHCQQDATSKCSTNKQSAVVPGNGVMFNKSDYHYDRFDTSSRTTSEQNKHSKSTKSVIRAGDMSKPSSFGNKFTLGDYMHNSRGRPQLNFVAENIPTSRDSPRIEEVGETTKLQTKHIRTCSESAADSTLSADAMKPCKPLDNLGAGGQVAVCIKDKDDVKRESRSSKPGMGNKGHSGFYVKKETSQYSTGAVDVCSFSARTRNPSIKNKFGSNSCSSCLSESNNSGPSSNTLLRKPLSTSESQHSSEQSVRGEVSQHQQGSVRKSKIVMDQKQIAGGGESIRSCWLDKKRNHTPAKVSQEDGIANPDFSEAENKGFSFFHFRGPVALADPYRSDSLPSEDVVGDRNKGVSFEEYKLFASTRGVTFSILGC
ncbi:hypothetical protein ACET3Z_024282 [Daucus carota]